MVKYQQMKFAALSLFAFLSVSALAGARVVAPSLPEAVRLLAEVETNVVFSVGAPRDNLWRLSVELDASVSNCVEVVLGCDADEDGALGIDEGGLSVGWSCGEWFWQGASPTGKACGALTGRLGWPPTSRPAPWMETFSPAR